MKISADRLHDGHRFLPAGSVLELGVDGEVLGIHAPGVTPVDRHYPGIVCPGFVNAHCHLELSHMAGVVPPGTGLIPFLTAVPRERFRFTEQERSEARAAAYRSMSDAGIVALGDIANTAESLPERSSGKMHVHSFVEALGFSEERAAIRMEDAVRVHSLFSEAGSPDGIVLKQSVTPHAPYSVSSALFRLIDQHQPSSVLSVHSGESLAEDAWYREKSGDVARLLEAMSIPADSFRPSGKSAIATWTGWISPSHSVIFVHNTYTGSEDAEAAAGRFRESHWCLCPGANLYIEGRLPDVPRLMRSVQHFCIGTDSLASNEVLSVWREIGILVEHFPESISLETGLAWGTSGGAAALGLGEVVGTFRAGMRPGVIHVDDGGGITKIFGV